MTDTTKIWIAVALCLLLAGAAIFTVAMMKLNWDFSRLNTHKTEANTYEISEAFTGISIDTNVADILLVPSQDGMCRVECWEYATQKHSVTVKDGTMTIRVVDTRKWYDHITFFEFNPPIVTLYLPQAEYESLRIKLSTGDVKLSKGLQFSDIHITASTGDVECYASASGNITISTSTGDIEAENISAADLSLSVTTGDTNLRNVTCHSLSSTGNTGKLEMENVVALGTFTITRTTGDVKLQSCDAEDITIKTDTGNVTGTLRSSKIFITKATTGRIQVPETTTGGTCKITTTTGDIKFTIQ